MCAFYARVIAIIIIIHLSRGLTCVDKTALEKKMHREQEYGFVSINLRVLEKGPRYYFIKQSEFHGFLFLPLLHWFPMRIYYQSIVYIATIRSFPSRT